MFNIFNKNNVHNLNNKSISLENEVDYEVISLKIKIKKQNMKKFILSFIYITIIITSFIFYIGCNSNIIIEYKSIDYFNALLSTILSIFFFYTLYNLYFKNSYLKIIIQTTLINIFFIAISVWNFLSRMSNNMNIIKSLIFTCLILHLIITVIFAIILIFIFKFRKVY